MDFKATIISNKPIAKDTYRLTVENVPKAAFDGFKPGKFAHIRVPNAPDLLLRRPLAIYGVDANASQMEYVYKIAGEGTRRLALARAGESTLIGAPLGNGFSIPPSAKTGFVYGGGTGCAALLSVAKGFPEMKWRAFLGFPDAESVFGEAEFTAAFESAHIYTNDGSAGIRGNPTDDLSEWLLSDPPDAILACGPDPMFMALKKLLPKGFPCQISVEERMACGVGACLVCACETLTENGIVNKRVCADGPVFSLWEVNFHG